MPANDIKKIKTTKVPDYVRNLDPKRYDNEKIHILPVKKASAKNLKGKYGSKFNGDIA